MIPQTEIYMKLLIPVAVLLTGCATTVTHIDKTETFPGYTMKTYVFGSAQMAESAQSFHGNLAVTSKEGMSVVVDMDNGHTAKGLSASGLEAVVNALVTALVKSFLPIPTAPTIPSLTNPQLDTLESILRQEYNTVTQL